MYEWAIDVSGELDDVVIAVEDAQPLPNRRMVRIEGVLKEVEVLPSQEDIADFERARSAILRELHDINTPFAGVCARYVENPLDLGGYTLSVSVSAFEKIG